MSTRGESDLWVPGIVLLAGTVGLLFLGPEGPVTAVLAILAVLAAAYLFAVRAALGAPARSFAIVFVGAVLFRGLLVLGPPALSDDVYRYAWDARVQSAGESPYGLAPVDERLAPLRDGEIHPRINHPDLPTIYPPAAEVLFRVAAALAPDHPVTALKTLFAAFDLGTVALVALLLAGRGRRPVEAVVYAWHPLALVEVAWSGHVEGAGVFFAVLAVWALERGRRVAAGVALAIATAVKLVPGLLFPLALPRSKGRAAAFLAAFAATLAALALPYLGSGPEAFASLRVYAATWSYNSLVWRALAPLPGDLGRAIVAVALAALAVLVAHRRARPVEGALAVLAGVVVLSPTLHPWYVLWPLPFVCVRRVPALLALSLTVLLSYWTLAGARATGTWRESPWVLAVEWGVPLAVLAAGGLRARGGRYRWSTDSRKAAR